MLNLALFPVFVLCSVSSALTLQVGAQQPSSSDSLALKALNRAFKLLPIELSMELRRGALQDAVPRLRALGVGYNHEVWGRYQTDDSVKFMMAFRRDSAAGDFGGIVTRRARIESLTIAYQANDFSRGAVYIRAFLDATAQLGGPNFCTRDTIVNDVINGVMLRFVSLWHRGEITVSLESTMNAMDVGEKHRPFAPRFYISYHASRGRELFSGIAPTRHDTPCAFSTSEIDERVEPLDSIAIDGWRRRLRARSP